MELSVIQRCYAIKKSIHTLANSLDKKYRYGTGKEAEDTAKLILENVLFAKHNSKYSKAPYIMRALVHLDMLRLTLRMMLDLKIADETAIFQIHEQAAEAGRMLGGWLKSTR